MKEINFHKYQGTGNDFIIIDNREAVVPTESEKVIARLCDRRYGVGADGLILLQNHDELDFDMIYYNADGKLSSMCGNGGRCIAVYARSLGLVDDSATFNAFDGLHRAEFVNDSIVNLCMSDVNELIEKNGAVILDTGSPHYVSFVEDVSVVDVNQEGKKIRNSKEYKEEGINVNFVATGLDSITIRTYERGVESETLSCGTGVVASALSAIYKGVLTKKSPVKVHTQGGELNVYFKQKDAGGFGDISLEGDTKLVYKGTVDL